MNAVFVGLGGLWFKAYYDALRMMRPNCVVLIDRDFVSASDRQYTDSEVGFPKVLAAAVRTMQVVPRARVYVAFARLQEVDWSHINGTADWSSAVITLTDNLESRLSSLGKFLLDSTSAAWWVSAGNDGESAWAACLPRSASPERIGEFVRCMKNAKAGGVGCAQQQTPFSNSVAALMLNRVIEWIVDATEYGELSLLPWGIVYEKGREYIDGRSWNAIEAWGSPAPHRESVVDVLKEEGVMEYVRREGDDSGAKLLSYVTFDDLVSAMKPSGERLYQLAGEI